MQSNTVRALVGAALVAAAVILFIVLQGGGDGSTDETTESAASNGRGAQSRAPGEATSTPPEPRIPTIVVEGGQPVGGVRELEFSRGQEIRFVVRSDVSDEVHVHGYDFIEDVRAGVAARFEFPADLEGIYEVELEGRGVQLAELRVSPG